jgi:DNA-binding response OmpR family regulator
MVRKKVVIIDDEEDLCHLMKTYLVELDYDVYLAYTLTSVMDLLQEISPDILFIDNNLPDGLGWEKMQYVKEKFPACKINLISAYQYVPPDMPSDYSISILEKPLRLNLLKDYL